MRKLMVVLVAVAFLAGASCLYAGEHEGEHDKDAGKHALASDIQEAKRLLFEVLEELLSLVALPQGAVVAFDRAEGCPDGWTNFSEAEGLVIVGANSDYVYRVQGGEKDILLADEHMPSHDHTFTDIYFSEAAGLLPRGMKSISVPKKAGSQGYDEDNVGWGFPERRTDPSGHLAETRALLNNMQPYLPLHFCKRD